MIRRHPAALLLLGLLLLLVGLAALYRLRLSRGESYPAYSTFRADPLGLRVLYESLGKVPGIEARRWLRPLEDLPADPGSTLLLAGVPREGWEHFPRQDAEALTRAARLGTRVVILLGTQRHARNTTAEGEAPERRERREKEEARRPARLPERLKAADLRGLWQLSLRTQEMDTRSPGQPVDAAARGWTELPWRSEAYWTPEPDSAWTVLMQREGAPVLMERPLGRGTLVVATESFFVSNEALHKHRSPELLAWLVGPARSVVFAEAHLGVAENTGIAALGRRYRLGLALGILALWALLFAWSQGSPLVPPPREDDGPALDYRQTAGLEALLRRAVPRSHLLATCLAEFSATAPRREAERVKQVIASEPADASPVDRYNAAARALRRR